jgi:hypothetical protein
MLDSYGVVGKVTDRSRDFAQKATSWLPARSLRQLRIVSQEYLFSKWFDLYKCTTRRNSACIEHVIAEVLRNCAIRVSRSDALAPNGIR